ncbi:RNA-binding protein FUS [Lingula anatina]|uniref:RNA-binding protein FUS n=1 Tax=Lingula anatina TaxID=7574 RepID=A0A1S3J4X3_LINAN|nr:RNA-binding protein FUS [Lingula anatina]|eukprot:XP_013405333.1 RNA-binding protein FUS [Lingula anatina]
MVFSTDYIPLRCRVIVILLLALVSQTLSQYSSGYQVQTVSAGRDNGYNHNRGYPDPQYFGPHEERGSYGGGRSQYIPYESYSAPTQRYGSRYEYQSPYSSLYHKLFQDYAHVKVPTVDPHSGEHAQDGAHDRAGQSQYSGGSGGVGQYHEVAYGSSYGDNSGSYGDTSSSYGDTSGSYGDTSGSYGDTSGSYGDKGRYHADQHRGERPTTHCHLYRDDKEQYEKCLGCTGSDRFFVCPVAGVYKPERAYGPKEEVHEAPRRHFAHTDPQCYWQCDEFGRAFGQPCPKGLTFNTHAQVCIRL